MSLRLFIYKKTSPLKLFFLAFCSGSNQYAGFSALHQLIDGVFVGRFLGEAAFAALNLAMPFVIINFSLADLIGVGSSVPISIHLGRGQEKEANNIFSCACLMIVITGTLIGGVLFVTAPWLIGMMGAKANLLILRYNI